MTIQHVRGIIAISIVGLYVTVVVAILGWSLFSPSGDLDHFFDKMNKANFLLGPVGFVLGYFFSRRDE